MAIVEQASVPKDLAASAQMPHAVLALLGDHRVMSAV
jgi:hypothetical protein